ncbi:Aminodeoxychorismate synthase [Hibiscus syriacus]|uniref:Aminodeoxychorismate synthase n=1 Tax=Hibiscus syriacus TaxID=106335 RepID=A0A6A2YAP0_HIBSY|nr:Aminodeoxychorismate synthase [Hibiscus syriacus]
MVGFGFCLKNLDRDQGFKSRSRSSFRSTAIADIEGAIAVPPVVVQNDELTWEGIRSFLYEEGAFDNSVISPGPGSPACPADIVDNLILSEPIHGRLSEIEHDGCKLLANIPSDRNSRFKVVRYHSLVIDGESLPEELIPIAWTSSDDTLSFLETQKFDAAIPNTFESERPQANFDSFSARNGSYWASSHVNGTKSRKLIMGIRHASWPHYGVQRPCSYPHVNRLFGAIHIGRQFMQGADRRSLGHFDMGRARFSFMGGKGGDLWQQLTFRLSEESNAAGRHGGHLLIEDAKGSSNRTFLEEGFFEYLNKGCMFQGYIISVDDCINLMKNFYGGFIGYIGYNLKVERGAESNAHKSTTPDTCLFFADNLVVIDHHSDDVYVMLFHEGNTSKTQWLDDTEKKLVSLKGSATRKLGERILKAAVNSLHEEAMKPIKGTIARGATLEEDERLKLQLHTGSGVLCNGSYYGECNQSNVSAVDCIKAAFPGGSMTGAPKLRSMEHLDSVEGCSRGIYSGSIGFFSYNQTFDLNIVIRNFVIHGDEASIGAGGAIVALSDPEKEYEEMVLKTRAPATAVMEF